MKHGFKSDEPNGLRNYRQSNPTHRWEDFRNECASGLLEVYQSLRGDQGGLCVYCEIHVSDDNHQVEHFHDKADESDTAAPTRWHLDWQNMWYACKGGTQDTRNPREYMPPVNDNCSCGQSKECETFEHILSPQVIPLFPRLFRYEQHANAIVICPDEDLCREADVDIARVQNTIDVLNLNCRRLCEARLYAIKPLRRILPTINPNSEQHRSLVQRFLGNRTAGGAWWQFFTMFRWALKKAAEDYLHEVGYNG